MITLGENSIDGKYLQIHVITSSGILPQALLSLWGHLICTLINHNFRRRFSPYILARNLKRVQVKVSNYRHILQRNHIKSEIEFRKK